MPFASLLPPLARWQTHLPNRSTPTVSEGLELEVEVMEAAVEVRGGALLLSVVRLAPGMRGARVRGGEVDDEEEG